jgi:hypothetical protein
MSARITVTLPDDLVKRATSLAQYMGKPVADFLAETIELSLQPLSRATGTEKPIAAWSDKEVMAAADLRMSRHDDRRLSKLLESQQADRLSSAEAAELTALMQVYQEGLLRKARALREAVRRGLRPASEP